MPPLNPAAAESTTPAIPAGSDELSSPVVRIPVGALLIMGDDSGRLVFVRQRHGPYAGSVLLPGGKVEAGETLDDAARREALEEASVQAGALTPCGAYDIPGHAGAGGEYRFLMFVFRAGPDAVRVAGGGHHIDEVMVADPDQVQPHPTVMRILTDAGVARYDPADIEQRLRDAGITMRAYPIGAAAC